MDPEMLMQMFGQGGGGQRFMNASGGGGLEQFLGGMFGNSGRPFKDAMNEYERWAGKGEAAQNPFLEAGKGAIPQFQEWLNGMKDPSGFINNLMGKYSESPWAKFQQEQAMRSAGNQGSASGTGGSTPMGQFLQQNARDISSQDMDKWLQNVLGINTQYGAGQNSLMQGGQHAADQLTGMYGDMGRQMGEAAAGRRAGMNQDRANRWGGAINMFRNGLFG